MKTVKIVDGAFRANQSLSMAGECSLEAPKTMRWDRTPGAAKVKVWTDAHIPEAQADPTPKKIAVLLESPCIRGGMYDMVPNLAHLFHGILTHYQPLVEQGEPYLFYPFAGTWIKESDWGVFPKEWDVSCIASPKKGQVGHRLRHAAIEAFPKIDAYGKSYGGWVPSKVPMLRPYRYSVVIENCQANWYFTEKLLDCLSQGTVPIYWGGCLMPFFNMAGIITFQTLEELGDILRKIGPEDYEQRRPAIRDNLERAREYRCVEDWIMARYPGLFDG